MTTEELHNFYTQPMKQETKKYSMDFLRGLGQVYTGVFSMTVTAVFGLPAFIFFAWLLGIVGKILWVSIQWAFNVVW